MRKILFASSEVHPLMKSGGLADVSASLPIALRENGEDIRIVMPAYRQSMAQVNDAVEVASLKLDGYHQPIRLLETRLPETDVPLWLVDSPHHFDRDGGPYSQPDGRDWHDNAARFALLSRAVVAIACNEAGLSWQPDIVHCNDWQTGLVPALLSETVVRPKTVFTIHNLAYQGLFPRETFDVLDLPEQLWHIDGLEFYGLLSFMKGGLVFADHITTVSPTYAAEICHYEYGYGLEGLLQLRSDQGRLTGILNGIDVQEWHPGKDRHLSKNYSSATLRNKAQNKAALQQKMYLPERTETLLVGLICRLVPQKGIDLTLAAMNTLLSNGADLQLVCLGSGDAGFEQELRVLRAKYPDKVAVNIGYDEALSHQIEAGADTFLMPSRFEPCGLNQMYSLRYGTLPVVRRTGGLADTVVDATEENLKDSTATGFVFEQASAEALKVTLERVLDLYQHPRKWRRMMLTAMAQDFSWHLSAQTYSNLYQTLNGN